MSLSLKQGVKSRNLNAIVVSLDVSASAHGNLDLLSFNKIIVAEVSSYFGDL